MLNISCPVKAKTKSRMNPTSVAVLKTFLFWSLDMFWVKPMKMGMFPNGSTIMKRTKAALAKLKAKATISDI